MFRSISCTNSFPPFGNLELNLPAVDQKPPGLAEVHLLTGVNGTGKTRLLALLAGMLGNEEPMRSRMRGVKDPRHFLVTGSGQSIGAHTPAQFLASEQSAGWTQQTPIQEWCTRVPAFAYNGAAYVADTRVAVMAGLQRPDRKMCLSFSRPESNSKGLLQGITNLKVQAAMDVMNAEARGTESRSKQVIRVLEAALTEITGQTFVFHVISYPEPTLVVRWAESELAFNLLPDGLRSIIGWMVDAVITMDAWLQGEGKLDRTEAVFLLDEIESHLHPTWQRRVLPAFQRLFPKSQIFVATHSPFVISSLNHGWIHRFTMDDKGRVKAESPVSASLGDSYIHVLEEIMGLSEWYDPETEKLLAEFRELRNLAFQGNNDAKAKAFEMGQGLASRSDELRFIMGKELAQMERRLRQK